jgi:hypothetical protein
LLTLQGFNFIVLAVHLELDLINTLVGELRLVLRLGYGRSNLGVRIVLVDDFSHATES